MNKRITYLDTAKGILILLMLIGHIWNEGFLPFAAGKEWVRKRNIQEGAR